VVLEKKSFKEQEVDHLRNMLEMFICAKSCKLYADYMDNSSQFKYIFEMI